MNYPEESIINARLYHTHKMQEAQAQRRAKKLMGANNSIWNKLAVKLQALKAQPQNTQAEDPTLLHSVN
jgi:hypothetical protein